MSRLIQIPYSNEAEKLDDFAVKYFDDFLMKNGKANWLVYTAKMIQKVGAGTRFTSHLSSDVKLTNDIVESVDISKDINLSRIIRRLQKRKGSGEVHVAIFKSGEVIVS